MTRPTNRAGRVAERADAPDRLGTVRNHRGEVLTPARVTASEAKSGFGQVLDIAMHGGAVVITKHDRAKAVLISIETFNALSDAGETRIDALTGDFDALLTRMQTPAARRGLKTAFAASGTQLGKAAAAAARKRG